jgi:hypothetical protein
MNYKLLAAAAAVATLGMANAASAAIAVGDLLEFSYYFPDLSNNIQDATFTYTGPASVQWAYQGVGVATTIDANTIDLNNACGDGCTWTNASFNGINIQDLTNVNAFSGWSVLPGNTQAYNSFSNGVNGIFVEWNGQSANGDLQLGGAVPEPATWAMMMVGVFGLGGALRRRREQTAVATTA